MITILWLIRSNQGILKYGGQTFWQDDWFLAALLTIMTLGADALIVLMAYGFIHNY